MRMRVGDLGDTIAPLQWAPDRAAPVNLTARVVTPAVGPVDVCAAAALARARSSPATAGLEAQCAALRAVKVVDVAKPSAVSASAPVQLAVSSGCGAEPARGAANASGARPYADPAKGAAWLACMDQKNAADQKALLAPIDAHAAGGTDGCGPEPAYNVASSGQKIYVNSELGAHWTTCRASAPSTSTSSSSGGSSSTPVQLAPSGGSGGGASDPTSASSGSSSATTPTQKTPTPADVSSAWHTATLAWFAFGAVAVGGVVWLAMRKKA